MCGKTVAADDQKKSWKYRKKANVIYLSILGQSPRGEPMRTPRGGNWLSHKFSNTSAFTNKTRFILLPRFLKQNLIRKKIAPVSYRTGVCLFINYPCQIPWFLMKAKPKTKNKFFSRHIMIWDRSLRTFL